MVKGVEQYNAVEWREWQRDHLWGHTIKESVMELEEPLRDLLVQLKPHFDQEVYGLLVGEDTSGRIPFFLLSRVVNTVNHRQGRSPVPGFLIQESHDKEGIDPEKLNSLRRKMNRYENVLKRVPDEKRALVITDHIRTGLSLDRLGKVLQERDISYDVATITSLFPRDYYSSSILAKRIPDEVGVFGVKLGLGDDEGLPLISSKEALTGIKRGNFPQRQFYTEAEYPGIRRSVHETLRYTAQVGERLVAFYEAL